jgi:hypothetical protein
MAVLNRYPIGGALKESAQSSTLWHSTLPPKPVNILLGGGGGWHDENSCKSPLLHWICQKPLLLFAPQLGILPNRIICLRED